MSETAAEVVIEDPVVLRSMNAVLVEQCVRLEDQLRNRDLADFADVVTDETREFWSNQLIENREGAIKVLTSMRPRVAAVPVVGRQPLHNRATARPVVAAIVAGAEDSGVLPARIRNRAHEISKADKIPFTEAFRRAEREISER